MQVQDGKGRGNLVEVNGGNQLMARAIVQERAGYISEELGQAYIVTVDDAGPVGAEYPIYLQNNSSTPIVIKAILVGNVDADVVWKLHLVTGTAAGASVLTPLNLNRTSGNVADVTSRGGAGGVTGLSSAGVLTTWYGGNVYSNTVINLLKDSLILGNGDAIALEYDAGTGGAATLSIVFHNKA